MIYLFAGLIIGFFVALPIGAAAILCINRTLQFGLKPGLFTGLGVALADLLYGMFAVFGLFAISGDTLQNQPVLRLAGSLCIMFIGLRMMSKVPDSLEGQQIQHETALKDTITGFLVTISNPMTIIAFVAALSYVNYLMEEINLIGSVLIVSGIFIGSLAWWSILSYLSLLFKDKLTGNILRKFNVGSGFLIFAFGILLIISINNF